MADHYGEALEDVRNTQVCLDFGGDHERVMGDALALFRLPLRDRHESARQQRRRGLGGLFG